MEKNMNPEELDEITRRQMLRDSLRQKYEAFLEAKRRNDLEAAAKMVHEIEDFQTEMRFSDPDAELDLSELGLLMEAKELNEQEILKRKSKKT